MTENDKPEISIFKRDIFNIDIFERLAGAELFNKTEDQAEFEWNKIRESYKDEWRKVRLWNTYSKLKKRGGD